VEDPRDAIIGIVLLLVSLPFYFYWTRWQNANRTPRPQHSDS
jgi:hypothetical protein